MTKAPDTFAGMPIVESDDVPPNTVRLVGRRPINVRKGFGRFEGVIAGVKIAPGWLRDDKGRVRVGPCGHPLRPRNNPLDLTPPKGDGPWCAVCRLLALDGADTIRCYTPNAGRISRAAGKWGSSKKKRNSANSYKPAPVATAAFRHEANDVQSALVWSGFSERGDDGPEMTLTAAIEASKAIARICPESSRTIRFRHGPWPRGVAGEPPAPLQIGAPLTEPHGLDDLHAMLSSFGSSIVQQQAALTQNTIDFTNLPDVTAHGYIEGAAIDIPSGIKSDATYTFTVTGVTPSKSKP